MTTVTIYAAKTQLSKLIARAEAGEEVIIARRREAGGPPRSQSRTAEVEASIRGDEGDG